MPTTVAAIVVTIGPLSRAVQGNEGSPHRYLVIALLIEGKPGVSVHVQR